VEEGGAVATSEPQRGELVVFGRGGGGRTELGRWGSGSWTAGWRSGGNVKAREAA
jgi:hypothetical protein